LEAILISFFVVAIAEIGDKTQAATVALAARFHSIVLLRPARRSACWRPTFPPTPRMVPSARLGRVNHL
jgi:uncharacterized protein UPF0016